MALIRRCYECRRPYWPYWHGDAELILKDAAGRPVGEKVHGHPTCLMSVFRSNLPKETA